MYYPVRVANKLMKLTTSATEMMTKKYIILTAFLLLSLMLQGQIPEAFKPRWDSLINAYKQRMEKVGIVGSSIVFVKEGEIITKEFYGYQDKDTKEPITLNTIYNWGSCTKPFTAIAVMQLRDKGLLKLEDPVSIYIPEVKQFKNKYSKEITIAHLLGHTSGLPRWSRTTKLEDGIFYEADNWEAYQQAFSETELAFEPGSQFMYSNIGYNLLGRLIQHITHVPFTEYVTSHILEPLDMKSSYFDFTPKHLEKYRSNNYRVHKRKFYSKGKDFTDGLSNPSGG
jgi:CubicO group peptidase (beta-lactamase class C family)